MCRTTGRVRPVRRRSLRAFCVKPLSTTQPNSRTNGIAKDHELAAVVAQVPHISGPASAFARSPRLVARLVLAALRDQLGAIVGRAPYRLPAVGEPGSLAMMTSPDALPMAERLAGERYEELLSENNVAARIALRVPFYSPGRVVGRITAPALVQLAKHDIVTPYEVALKAVRRIPKARSAAMTAATSSPT